MKMEGQFGNSRKPGRTAGCVWMVMKGDVGSDSNDDGAGGDGGWWQ